MFTSINAVLKQLNAEGWNDITLEYINKGVMTDTYKMHTKTDCHMHSISAHYISVHQKFINKQQPC